MELPELFLAGLISTSIFTLGCLLVTWLRNKPSGEPVILKRFLARLGVSEYEVCEQTLAFVIRYSISLIFIFAFEVLTETSKSWSVISPAVLKILTGLLGIILMRLACKLIEMFDHLHFHNGNQHQTPTHKARS